MEMTDIPMNSVHLGYRDDVDYELDSLPGNFSTASVSGSSYASSSFGPHTPRSARSTPVRSNSMDFGSSFTSSFASSVDSVPFELTPPSSATTPCFSTALRPGDAPDFVCAGFPLTPSRNQFNFAGPSVSNCGTQWTPPQRMDCNFLIGGLGPHPNLSTHPGMAQMGQPSDVRSSWLADSPISFEGRPPMLQLQPGFHEEGSPSGPRSATRGPTFENEENMTTPMMPSVAVRRRVRMEKARLRTTVLQEIQQGPQSTAQLRNRIAKHGRSSEQANGNGISTARNKFKCPHEGCKTEPYRRREHLKRHIQSAHKGTLFVCEWCGRQVNRKDNWMSHLRLHTLKRGKSGRVGYEPGAVKQYAEEQERIGARRKQPVKSRKRTSPVS
ncbi:hypothetical protein VTK26DRAFT_9162 [Humicola hyalothermophila]